MPSPHNVAEYTAIRTPQKIVESPGRPLLIWNKSNSQFYQNWSFLFGQARQ
jgi:hypothetical protein